MIRELQSDVCCELTAGRVETVMAPGYSFLVGLG